MNILIIGAGDIGKALAAKLLGNGQIIHSAHHNDYMEKLSVTCYDIVINCCGIFEFTSITEDLTLGLEKWDRVFAANTRKAWEIASNFYRISKDYDRQKTLVNIGSESAEIPHANSVAYCASKAALQMMTKCLAKALEKENFRVFQVNCGVIEGTQMANKIKDRYPNMEKGILLNKLVEKIILLLSIGENGIVYHIE